MNENYPAQLDSRDLRAACTVDRHTNRGLGDANKIASRLETEMSRIESTLTAIDKLLAIGVEQLRPVLAPPSPEKQAKDGVEQPAVTELEESVRQLRWHAEGCQARLAEILERVRL